MKNLTKLLENHTLSKHKLARYAFLILLGNSLLAISAHIAIPFFPVPITLQSLMVLLIGMLYGSQLGATTVITYLAIGATGLPVFAYSIGGFTAGYLCGFAIAAFVSGCLIEHGWGKRWTSCFAAAFIGDAIIFICGLAVLQLFLHNWQHTLATGLYPFLLGDFLKTIFATVVVKTRLTNAK